MYKRSHPCGFLYFKSFKINSQNVVRHVFDVTDHPGVDGSGQIEKFQEKALMELQDYVQKAYPDDTYRYFYTIYL